MVSDSKLHHFHSLVRARSLAGRTARALLLGLVLVQGCGFAIHTADRVALQRGAQARAAGFRLASLYQAVIVRPPGARAALLDQVRADTGIQAVLAPTPSIDAGITRGFPQEHVIYEAMHLVPIAGALRPSTTLLRESGSALQAAMHLPDGLWLNCVLAVRPPDSLHSGGLLIGFGLMTLAAGLLILWGVRRLTAPLRTLAQAAEALGRDVNAPALPEDGPQEVAVAAAAFNRMSERIRRFVGDRTLLLAAIGHDLRTPITRLKLRAEFIEDEEQRLRFIADLDELETMVAATLAFGRDAASGEPMVPLDLPVLLRTILDEAGDARPDAADALHLHAPAHLTVRARPVALKRALANLIGNAVKYAGSAVVTLDPMAAGTVAIAIEDDGPGVPPDALDRVFEPFHRVETSRNRETGGTGLGLPIARNILRAHGGDVTIANRTGCGLRVTIILPQ